MNKELREAALKLRTEKELSYTAIAKRLRVSKSTLSYWLRNFQLSESKIKELKHKGWERGEISREKFRLTMRKKREREERLIFEKYRKQLSTSSRDSYFVAGLMLYLAEGNKTGQSTIALSNTDPQIIQFFIKWLVDFLKIPVDKMRCELHLYENMNLKKEKGFWESQTGFIKSQFYKSQIKKLKKSSFSYKESYRHGTCKIIVLGVKKKTELMMAMKAFVSIYLKKGI